MRVIYFILVSFIMSNSVILQINMITSFSEACTDNKFSWS